jgi:phage shock protein C
VAKRLYRSSDDRVIAGVCGGLAKYFDIDPIIGRVLAAVSILVSGVGPVAYVVLWIVAPPDDSSSA